MVERLQAKASSIGKILSNLEKRYVERNSHGEDSLKKSPSGQQIGQHPPNKKAHLKIQQIPPFNASKIRKSPSSNEEIKIEEEEVLSPSTPKEIEDKIPEE